MTANIKRVTVIGAGIGGLCAAIALHRLGMEVAVYEQADAFGAVGAGLTLWANAIKALRKLGIAEEALGGSRLQRSDLLDWKGRVISSMRVDQMERVLGASSLAVHRADLHRVLLAALPEGTVHTGRACTGFEQEPEEITACFADGSRVQSDLLVGADGIHSVIRQELLPEVRLRYSGYIAWRGIVDTPLAASYGRTSESWGRGARFGIVPIGKSRIYWFATANLPAGRKLDLSERKAELERRFKGWHAPVEALIENTPKDQILYNDIYDFPPVSSWGKGRAVLLGDAIHPTTPNMGQGACQAVESSVALARSLAEEADLNAALARYQRERQPRTAWITQQSWRIGQVGQVDNPLLCAVRDFVMRTAPESVTRSQLIKAAGYEV